MRTRTCTACNTTKPFSDFHQAKREALGITARCKSCISLNSKEKYKENIELRRLKNRYSHYRNQYGLTPEQVDGMRILQDHRCAICRRKEAELNHVFRVDHDHITGTVRGLLCHNCNCGIGHLRDSVDLLKAAITYLENSK